MTSYLLAGPAIEPVSLSEAKAYCRVDGDAEDGLVATLVAAARVHVEAHTCRALIAQSWRAVRDGWPMGCVPLPVTPAISLTAIRAYDEDDAAHPLALEQFQLDPVAAPALLLLPDRIDAMPVLRRHRGIEIDYVAGYGEGAADVPADLRQAILLLVAHWFENRDSTFEPTPRVPAGFAALVAPYRRVRL